MNASWGKIQGEALTSTSSVEAVQGNVQPCWDEGKGIPCVQAVPCKAPPCSCIGSGPDLKAKKMVR